MMHLKLAWAALAMSVCCVITGCAGATGGCAAVIVPTFGSEGRFSGNYSIRDLTAGVQVDSGAMMLRTGVKSAQGSYMVTGTVVSPQSASPNYQVVAGSTEERIEIVGTGLAAGVWTGDVYHSPCDDREVFADYRSPDRRYQLSFDGSRT